MKTCSQINIRTDSSFDQEKIKEQLQKILDSSEFQATESQAKFLRFVVLESLAGRAHELKGYSIATRVFGRSANFDASLDPIVSMHANKLRRALERYYLMDGIEDAIRIDIPKGAYVPTFTEQQPDKNKVSHPVQASRTHKDESWPAVEIKPFINLTGVQDNDISGLALATEIAVEIGRSHETKAILISSSTKDDTVPPARFVLDGNLFDDEEGISATLYLRDRKRGEQVFGNSFQSKVNAANFLSCRKELAGTIAVNIAGEYGVIAKILTQETAGIVTEDLAPYEAILRYYEFDLNSTDENAANALKALHHTTEVLPDYGLSWSFLARLYVEFHCFGIPGFEDVLDKAMAYAENGVRLDPNNQMTLSILGMVHFHCNDLKSARYYLNRALEISPDSLLYIDGIGYILALAGEWKRGITLIRKAMRLNPYYGPYVHYALWLDCIRQKNYEQALLETTGIIRSSIFWHPLTMASTLGLLGKYQEGEKFFKKLLKLKPDFGTNGRILIEHYIKSEQLRDRVIEGLEKVGMTPANTPFNSPKRTT